MKHTRPQRDDGYGSNTEEEVGLLLTAPTLPDIWQHRTHPKGIKLTPYLLPHNQDSETMLMIRPHRYSPEPYSNSKVSFID